MKCAIYTRVSTDNQETSIVNQQEYFKDYIQRNNLEIFDIYSDEAFSGTETKKRLSFQRLLQDGKNKKYDILLAKSYSRFGRNQRETLTALSQLVDYGIRVIFIEDNLDSRKDMGQFGLFAWLAEQEARKISERIKMTWQLYNKEGKIHSTTETYGYNYDKSIRNFVVNEEEAVVVRTIFDMYLQGNGTAKIAFHLRNNGISTKQGKNWCGVAVQRVIVNKFYLGYLIQGKKHTIDISLKKQKYLDEKDWYIHKGNHEAIIPEDIFHKAQAEYKKRGDYLKSKNPTRHSKAYLFSNLVTCKICGSSCMSQEKKHMKTERCYTCRSYEMRGKQDCGHRRNAIPQSKLTLNVKSSLDMLAENDFKVVRDYYNQNSADKMRERATLSLATLDKQIEEQTRLGNSLLELFTECIIGKEQYKAQNDSIAKKFQLLTEQREIALIEQNWLNENVDNEGETIKFIDTLLKTDINDWTNEMMKKVIDKIYIDMRNEVVEVVYNYAITGN
ncbi:MAG: recombinase family protein [Defluviitaleaceae bacterium]|nr:recombinase family protein [Defluviitaleaceae bacterium]MCL2263580.1 recombinase family protein [Defluviitaleaceae bacterium]